VGSTASWALGRCRDDGVARLREDDGVAGLGTVRVVGVTGSGTASGAQHRRLSDDNVVVNSGTTSRAWGWHLRGRQCHWHVPGKMATRKGARPWSGETTWKPRGGLDDGSEALGRTQRWHGL
jgi:hypothetical protein